MVLEPNRFGSDGFLSEMAQFSRSHAAAVIFLGLPQNLWVRMYSCAPDDAGEPSFSSLTPRAHKKGARGIIHDAP